MRVIFVGDVVGKIGRRMLQTHLTHLKQKHRVQYAIANGENAAHGKGVTERTYKEMISAGADFLTLGNHAFGKREVYDLFKSKVKMIRPANYPSEAPGSGFETVNINGKKLSIINLQGRSFLPAIDCPFKKADEILNELNSDEIIIDFHSETTSESLAMGYYLDGRVSAVVGTHTHVQTNDAKKLNKGTLYITDVGMTGFKDGILGIKKEDVIHRFITGLPVKHIVPDSGNGILSYVILDFSQKKIEAYSIEENNLGL